jgi:hypothetical protein
VANPTKIGPFQVVRELGQGGAGVVYEVVDPLTGRALALKLLHDEGADPHALERFQREAELLARVHHRSVVRVHKTGRLREGTYLLEELVPGETLKAVCARGPVEPRRAAAVVRELADALVAVHAAGVLHRDLKPGNVLLQEDGIPVLLDFGVARDTTAERLTRTGVVIGSPVYMSPEQADGVRSTELDGRVDVYGLGTILYELLTGQAPFAGESLQVLRQIIKVDPPWPASLRRDVPAALDAVVRKAMSKVPADRYPDAAALRDDLDRFLAEGRTAARAPRARRGPGLAVAGGGVIVALGAAAVVWLGRGEAPPEPTPAPDPRVERPLAPPSPVTEPPPPPPLAPLWQLAPGSELEARFTYTEGDDEALMEVSGELRARVASATPEQVVLEVELRSAQIGLGSPFTGIGVPFDTRDPPADHPLSPVAAAAGGRFRCTIDPRAGTTTVAGMDAVCGRVAVDDVTAVQVVDRHRVRNAVRVLLSDAFMDPLMGSLLGVRGEGALPWTSDDAGEPGGETVFTLTPGQGQRIVPPLLRPAAPGPARLAGRSVYARGRFREGTLSQEDQGPDGGSRSSWSLRLAE